MLGSMVDLPVCIVRRAGTSREMWVGALSDNSTKACPLHNDVGS